MLKKPQPEKMKHESGTYKYVLGSKVYTVPF